MSSPSKSRAHPQASPSDPFAPLPANLTGAPAAPEEEVLALWRDEQTFARIQEARRTAAPFVFWEGPPTANGRPGIHHVLARTLKDIFCRYQTMLGHRVERKAGWDTHGLPVELEVEKALGISGKPQIEALGVAAFNQKCRESVWKYREEWERLSGRIGYWLDYDAPYVTYEPEYIDSVWYLLASFHRAGLVYRGKRVLPYCGRCGTGLSSHELGQPGVYRDVLDPSVTVRFPLRDAAGPEPESFLAWTTTPWTLPSNFALAVHPEREYVRARVALPVKKGEEPGSAGSEVVWVVRERAQAVLGQHFEELGAAIGSRLVGKRYTPLFDARVPFADPGAWEPDPSNLHQVVPGEFVTVEDGTGIVHQAPYGADDWETARAQRMPLPEAVGREGRFVCDVDGVNAGTFFKDADEALTGDLRARGLLFHKSRESHSYPHCWRCDTPLFYFPTPAWYIRTTAYKERMLAANAKLRWIPAEAGDKRFGEWLENNVDWNISRDRYWGTPLPFWVCADCGKERAIGSARELKELAGSLPEGFDSHKPSIDAVTFPCPECGKTMRRTPAVLDCWFDSGAMPFAQHGWPHKPLSEAKLRDQFPADYVCEGLDQTRGWFYTLHAIGTFMSEYCADALGIGASAGPTYRTCLVNGLVLDKDGVKMSKRLGNVVDPWAVIGDHGADAVRWYLVASAAPWLPKRFDPNGLVDVRRRFFSTLHNSYNFFREYARVDRFDPASPQIPPLEARPQIDRWLASRTQSLVAEVRSRFDDFDVTGAARALETFVVDELSNWYIRRNRRRFWKSTTGEDKLAAFATLHDALRAVSLLVAPIAPFLAEMLWRRLEPAAGSVHAQLFPEADRSAIRPDLEASMEIVQRIVVMGRALREKAGHRVRQPLRAMHVRSSDPRSLELLGSSFATSLVLDELNIRGWGSLAADDGRLCRLSAKANFKALGPRLGARMKSAATAIASLPAGDLSRLRAGEAVALTLEGEAFELKPDDVLVTVESQAEFEVETDGRFVVWLDTELDGDLILEGLAREAVSRINGLRKERGLAVEDRIRLQLHASGEELARALDRHRELIQRETLAETLAISPRALAPAGSADAGVARFDLGSAGTLECALERV
jgi:isoleucyl-tRNA synthetase